LVLQNLTTQKVLQKSEEFVEALSLIIQLHPLRLRRECPASATLSLWVPVRRPALIVLNLPLTTLVGIIEKRKILTCLQDTTRAKLERLRSARLIHRDQTIMNRHANNLNKTNELISLLATILSIVKHVISQIKLINMIRLAFYSKHAIVSKQNFD
jgi:hypothetical protein